MTRSFVLALSVLAGACGSAREPGVPRAQATVPLVAPAVARVEPPSAEPAEPPSAAPVELPPNATPAAPSPSAPPAASESPGALRAAGVPFATYLNTMHNRLHPLFADRFLPAELGVATDVQPAKNVSVLLEIVIAATDGSVARVGIVRTSGLQRFDRGAIDSVRRAAPFGAAPAAIVSHDGNVYMHWEFHRNLDLACSTYFVRPFLLPAPPAPGS